MNKDSSAHYFASMKQRRSYFDEIVARAETETLSSSTASLSRTGDLRVALWLTYITLGWMMIEGAAALWLGWASNSLLLKAFGIDSVIELFSGFVLLWRLGVEMSGVASAESAEDV